ncbi:MAG: glycosyltransferase family 2 protein [Melioribacteraceae bacterium]
MQPKLDVIIVNWNSGTLLSECIGSINNAVQNSFYLNRVVVIDNASNDGSLDNLENINLPLTIIRNAQNLGFARACNQGAKASEADYLLFLNPDTRLFSNSLSVPISFLNKKENDHFGIAGIQLRDDKNEICRNCARFPSAYTMITISLGLDRLFPKLFSAHFLTEWDHKESKEVDQVMGSFLMIRRKLFEQLNGYDESYFVYFEDMDLSFRARNAGKKSIYLADAYIYHKGGGTTEQIKANRLFYYLRSKMNYSKKHFTIFEYYLIAAVILFIEPLIRIIDQLLKGSIKGVPEIASAYKMLFKSFR